MPSELGDALKGIGGVLGHITGDDEPPPTAPGITPV